MVKADEYMLDADEHGKVLEESRGRSKGIICPKMNLSIGGTCAVCDKSKQLRGLAKSAGEDKNGPYNNMAYDIQAKANFFVNIVFPSSPEQIILLEMGKKAGNQILEGIKKLGWTDIAHPKKGVGREMICSKGSDSGYNTYNMSINPNKAEWDVPKAALDGRYNLDTIIDIVEKGEVEVFKISSLKMDEVLRFRVLPPWDNGDGNRRVMIPLWRHWGVNQDQIDGKSEVNLTTPEEPVAGGDDGVVSWEGETTDAAPDTGVVTEGGDTAQEACFGMESCYAEDSDECKACKDLKGCMRTIMKAKS